MKEVKVTSTKYECENCGTKHSDEDKIYHCPLTNKEICDKCSVQVTIFDTEENLFGVIDVHPDCIKEGYDFWKWDYTDIVNYIREEANKKINEVTKKYLQNDGDYIRSYVRKIEQWKFSKEQEEE